MDEHGWLLVENGAVILALVGWIAAWGHTLYESVLLLGTYHEDQRQATSEVTRLQAQSDTERATQDRDGALIAVVLGLIFLGVRLAAPGPAPLSWSGAAFIIGFLLWALRHNRAQRRQRTFRERMEAALRAEVEADSKQMPIHPGGVSGRDRFQQREGD